MKQKGIVVIVVLLMLNTQFVYGHPAGKVNANYKTDDHMLTILVDHTTKDISKHRIDQIVVQLNGTEVVLQTFSQQMDQEKQKAVYFLPEVKEGDEIIMIARCNVYGKKKTKIKVGTE